MIPERIEEIEARLANATPGPWKFKEHEYGYSGLEGGDGQYIFYPCEGKPCKAECPSWNK